MTKTQTHRRNLKKDKFYNTHRKEFENGTLSHEQWKQLPPEKAGEYLVRVSPHRHKCGTCLERCVFEGGYISEHDSEGNLIVYDM